MSYNVTACHSRKIKGFAIPIPDLLVFGVRIVRTMTIDGTVITMESPEFWQMKMRGEISPDEDHVAFEEFGFHEIHGSEISKLEKMMKHSMGQIEFVIVWECGDKVEIVTWIDGKKTTEQIV